MRTYFSAALALAVAQAQRSYGDFAPDSPYMAIGRLGEGLDMATRHEYSRGELDHGHAHRTPTAIDHSRYFEPAHSAERLPIHHREAERHSLYDIAHDVEDQDPKHVFHSAEQLPPLAPHAFDDRHHDAEQRAQYHY